MRLIEHWWIYLFTHFIVISLLKRLNMERATPLALFLWGQFISKYLVPTTFEFWFNISYLWLLFKGCDWALLATIFTNKLGKCSKCRQGQAVQFLVVLFAFSVLWLGVIVSLWVIIVISFVWRLLFFHFLPIFRFLFK